MSIKRSVLVCAAALAMFALADSVASIDAVRHLGASDAAPQADLVWQTIGPTGGTIGLLSQSPNFPQVVYAVSSRKPITPFSPSPDSLFRSFDGGRSWDLASDQLADVTSIAVDPRNPRTLLAGSNGGLLKSTDAGATWSPSSAGLPLPNGVYALAFDNHDPRLVYAAVGCCRDVIFRSFDGGASWLQAPHQRDDWGVATSLLVDPTRPGRIYLATDFGLFLSRNYGRRWFPVGFEGFDLPQTQFQNTVAMGRDGVLYAVGGRDYTLYRSTDGGESWEGRNAWVNLWQLVVSSAGELFGLDFSKGLLFYSSDGGWSFSTSPLPVAHYELGGVQGAMVADGPGPGDLLLAAPTGVVATADHGANWTGSSRGLRAAQVWDLTAAPLGPGTSILYGVFSPGVLKRSRPAGPGWITTDLPNLPKVGFFATPPTAIAVDPSQPRTVWASDSAQVWKSRDGGISWEATAPLPLQSCTVLAAIAVAPTRSDTVVVVGFQEDSYICDSTQAQSSSFRTADGGRTWQPIPAEGNGVVVDPADAEVLYVFGSAERPVARSTDGGATWVAATGPGVGQVRALAIDPRDTQLVYAASSLGLLASQNRGQSFHPVHRLPAGPAAGIALDARRQPSTLYVAIQGAGVLASDDGGATWSPLGIGLPDRLSNLLVDPAAPDTLVVGSDHGVYRLQLPSR
jgi:photosystem II stability/assembly factor-like uncharacterized protein